MRRRREDEDKEEEEGNGRELKIFKNDRNVGR